MENKPEFTPDPKLKLIEQVRHGLHYHHYGLTTEKTHSQWIIRYIENFGVKRHPREMDLKEIESFLNYY